MIKLNGETLYQWETGRTVSGFTGNVAQFANAGDSIAMSITVANGGAVRIPDRYLATGKNLVVYDVQTGKDNEETVISVKVFPVKGKAKPKDYVPTAAEEAYDVVKKLSEEAQAAAQTAEAAKNSARTYAMDADDSAKNAYNFATNAKASADKAAEEVKKLAPLTVVTTEESWEANYGAADIFSAVSAGRDVLLRVDEYYEAIPDGYYALAFSGENIAIFFAKGKEELRFLTVDENKTMGSAVYPLDLLDDKKEDSSHTWSSKKILEMIARGGTRDIDMGGRNIFGAAAVSADIFSVAPPNSDGFLMSSFLRDDDFRKPVAEFYGTHGDESVVLTNIAPGTQPFDAVNKRQMEVALADKAKIDDSKIGADAWSSKNIIDKLCPPINETGLLVQCEPVEGYPLEVQARKGDAVSGVTVTVCGKNLYDKAVYPLTTDGYPYKKIGNFAKSNNYKRTDFIPVQHLAGQTITLNYAPVSATNPGMAFYTRIPNVDSVDDCKDAFCGGGSGYNTTVPADAVYMCFCVAVGDKDKDVQLEIGGTATDYEPYSAEIYKRDGYAAAEFIPVENIDDRSGLTTIFAYIGIGDRPEEEIPTATEVKVFGKADPTAEIRRLNDNVAELKAAILTMGANV